MRGSRGFQGEEGDGGLLSEKFIIFIKEIFVCLFGRYSHLD